MKTQMENKQDDEKDESLNVQSEKFNPLHALYSKSVVLPFPSAPILDNVAKVTSLLSRNEQLVNKPRPTVKLKKEVEPSTSSDVKHEQASMVSNKEETGRRHEGTNVLTYMSKTEGPLSCLRTCMEKRIRIKVWTRDFNRIRGYCLGFVRAFDKHWNLALEDVQEVWTRRKRRKTFLLGEANEMPIAWKAMGPMVKPAKVIVTKETKKTETCERHVNQLMEVDLMSLLTFLEDVTACLAPQEEDQKITEA